MKKDGHISLRVDQDHARQLNALAERFDIPKPRAFQLAITYGGAISGHDACFACPKTWVVVGSYLMPDEKAELRNAADRERTSVSGLARARLAAFLADGVAEASIRAAGRRQGKSGSPSKTSDEWLSSDEVAKLYDVPPEVVAEAARVGCLFNIRIFGNVVHYKKADVYAILSLLNVARAVGYDAKVHAAGVEARLKAWANP